LVCERIRRPERGASLSEAKGAPQGQPERIQRQLNYLGRILSLRL